MAAGHEFWADRVKRLKRADKNREIVDVCKLNLPLAGAFNEMAVALRKQIRARRKERRRYNDLLRQLYQAAVWQDFLADADALCLADTADSCKVASQFIPRIKCDYNLIGYEFLDMLVVTDVKWILAAWGEPKQHVHARQINRALYAEAVARYKLESEREQRSAGRLFGDQQLKLTDPEFGRVAEDEADWAEPDRADGPAWGAGDRRKRNLIICITVAVIIVLLVIGMAV